MSRKFIDLSIPIEAGLPSDPPGMIPEITYTDHALGAEMMKMFYPIDNAGEALPDGLGWTVELLNVSTHSGTHMDAPWHYHPTMESGQPAWTIDEVPLEWCMGDGIRLDFSHVADGEVIRSDHLKAALDGIGYTLKEKDIVLINTGADRNWGKESYLLSGAGMCRESTLWLIEQGVRVMGTDAWSWDIPLPIQAERFKETGNAALIWEAHFAGIEKWYLQLEKLTNLAALPSQGFTLFCFPIKIKRASAGWVRAVALVDG